MVRVPLVRRKRVLSELGLNAPVSRSSWSHDLGHTIAFDAWEHRWEKNTHGELSRYPLRTKAHYNLAQSKQAPRRGHTRWQNHVDLVVAGKRKACALMPVPN